MMHPIQKKSNIINCRYCGHPVIGYQSRLDRVCATCFRERSVRPRFKFKTVPKFMRVKL